MSSRDAMLATIRSKVSKGNEEVRRAAVDAHLRAHPRNLIPARGIGDDEHRLAVFTEMMQAVGGSVEVVDDINDVPHAAADYLRNTNLPAKLRRGSDEVLAKLPLASRHAGDRCGPRCRCRPCFDHPGFCWRRRIRHHHPDLRPR